MLPALELFQLAGAEVPGLEEELVDLGYDGAPTPVQHFRSDDMLFTFRSRLPFPVSEAPARVETAGQWLLAYEQCFSQLGDMSAEEKDG